MHDLDFARADPDGTLWLTAWNGLVALREGAQGAWKIDRTIEVDTPARVTRLLGETASAWYLACDPSVVVRVGKR
ncbi:MAG: hypothetical protein HKN62_01075 [Phycisphaerales bacterium]|nr:hypothetical protein [Phycisphaerales bacterium]